MSVNNITQTTQAITTEPLVPVNFMGTPVGGFRFGQARIDFQAHLATLVPAPQLKINFGTHEFTRLKRSPGTDNSSKVDEDAKI